MSKAVKHLWNLSQNEVLREYLEALDKKERDRISREEFVREEATEKGIQKERREIASNMLKSGVDIQIILNTTKLSREELEELKKYLNSKPKQ